MDSRAPEQGAEQPAYISFASALEALVFASLAGPPSWNRRDVERRSQAWDWQVWGREVRFPCRDIGHATAALQRHHWRLEGLLGAALGAGSPHRSGEQGLPERTGAVDDGNLPLPSAPNRCPVCGGLRMSRRKGARYCSRRCQLAARDRRRTVDGAGVEMGTEAAPVAAVGAGHSGDEPERPAEVVPEPPSTGPAASAPGGEARPAPPANSAADCQGTSVAVGGTPGEASVASGSPPLVSAEVLEVYQEVQPYGGSQDFASGLVTACRKGDPLCSPTQVAEVVRSHHADIRDADNAIAWILGQVPRFFEGGYQRPGEARRENLEGQIRVLRRLQK